MTLSSVFCGFDSIRLAAGANNEAAGGTPEDFHRAAILIVFAMIFDMLDGRVARMTKTQSAFGLQIDSLADVISFGVAPAMLVYQWSLHKLGTVVGLIASFVYVACAAIRLARYLRWPWRLLGAAWIVPRPIRDHAYDWVARNRYRWFGRRDTCLVPTPALRSRFLDAATDDVDETDRKSTRLNSSH